MDQGLQALLSWNFILFCLAISMIMFFMRTIADYIASLYNKDLALNKFWSNVVLPLGPIVIGVICGLLAKKYPFPDGITSISGRVAFGLVSGGLSTILFGVVKSMLKAKLTEAENTINNPISQRNPVNAAQTNTIDITNPGGPGGKSP